MEKRPSFGDCREEWRPFWRSPKGWLWEDERGWWWSGISPVFAGPEQGGVGPFETIAQAALYAEGRAVSDLIEKYQKP